MFPISIAIIMNENNNASHVTIFSTFYFFDCYFLGPSKSKNCNLACKTVLFNLCNHWHNCFSILTSFEVIDFAGFLEHMSYVLFEACTLHI